MSILAVGVPSAQYCLLKEIGQCLEVKQIEGDHFNFKAALANVIEQYF